MRELRRLVFECRNLSVFVGDLREQLAAPRAHTNSFGCNSASAMTSCFLMAVDQRLTRSMSKPPVSSRIERSAR